MAQREDQHNGHAKPVRLQTSGDKRRRAGSSTVKRVGEQRRRKPRCVRV